MLKETSRDAKWTLFYRQRRHVRGSGVSPERRPRRVWPGADASNNKTHGDGSRLAVPIHLLMGLGLRFAYTAGGVCRTIYWNGFWKAAAPLRFMYMPEDFVLLGCFSWEQT